MFCVFGLLPSRSFSVFNKDERIDWLTLICCCWFYFGINFGVCLSRRCSHEYIDLYTEIPDSEPVDLIHSPFGGRYCGQIPPRRRVSLYRTAVLGFFTDKNSTTSDDLLFQGTYLFFKDGV